MPLCQAHVIRSLLSYCPNIQLWPPTHAQTDNDRHCDTHDDDDMLITL